MINYYYCRSFLHVKDHCIIHKYISYCGSLIPFLMIDVLQGVMNPELEIYFMDDC